MRRTTLSSLVLAPLLVAGPHAPVTQSERADPADWSPAPTTVGGLELLATADEDGFVLRTEGGERTFLPGVNLGSTVPLHQPGEVGILQAADYRRWFAQMGELGIRVVRTYTIHPPAFYDELARYAALHPDAPLYLVQGAYFPDESYAEGVGTLLDPAVDDAFAQELLDVSAAVHGDLVRDARPGRAGGTWTTDVSHLLVGWVVGVELEPLGVLRTDALAPAVLGARGTTGTYVRATTGATVTERWLADHLDALAAAEAARGSSAPLAFVNWSPTDPLPHPTETLDLNDLVGVDANHVLATDAWPAGMFASYHAYPYYPDFLRDEPGLDRVRLPDGRPDRYAGYLAALRDHHAEAGLPLLVTELGVPSSLGSAHLGPLGRDQGEHSEQEAMAIDAELLRIAHAQGAGGAFLFSWTDEWFKRTWNTMEHQDPERRHLWHDPLTNEQHFGLLATDSGPVEGAVEVVRRRGPVSYAYVRADASWVHVDLALPGGLPRALRIEADSLDEVPGPDQRVLARLAGPGRPAVRVEVRRELDPVRLDTTEPAYVPDHDAPWHLFRLLMNRAVPGRGMEHQDVGLLRRGTWDPDHPAYDSLATWDARTRRGVASVRLRLPWSMLGYADPSARRVLGPGAEPALVQVDGLDLAVSVDGSRPLRLTLRWPGWNRVDWSEREKAGMEVVEEAFRDLAG